MKSTKIRPLHDRVLIKRLAQETQSHGGIIIPDTAKEKPVYGSVTAVGPGRRNDKGELVLMDVKVGDVVLFGKYAGTEVVVSGEEHLILREEEILGIVS